MDTNWLVRYTHTNLMLSTIYNIHEQIKYNPRNILGFGLSDGDIVECLWSYLRRFAAMTKEMHPSHRIDILSDALTHYRQKASHPSP